MQRYNLQFKANVNIRTSTLYWYKTWRTEVLTSLSLHINFKAYPFAVNTQIGILMQVAALQDWENFRWDLRLNSTQLGLSLDEEECKNSMQSSTVSARWESVRSDNERDLTKVDEETFLEDLLLTETLLIALATFSPSLSSNLTGEEFVSTCNLNVHVLVILIMFLETLPPSLLSSPQCLRKRVGLSLTSGLKHTLLLFLDIWTASGEY